MPDDKTAATPLTELGIILNKYFPQLIAAVEALKPKIGHAVKIQMEVKSINMNPTLVLDSATNRIFVIGVDLAGAKGASLAAGDSVALTVDNDVIATISLDPTPLPDPTGTPSVASGVISPVAPIVTGTPFNAVAVATIGGVAQPPVNLPLQWQAGTTASVLEEVN